MEGLTLHKHSICHTAPKIHLEVRQKRKTYETNADMNVKRWCVEYHTALLP